MDPTNFLGLGSASDKGGSDKFLPFQNPYPGKLRGGGGVGQDPWSPPLDPCM